jgi:hypothetical protein
MCGVDVEVADRKQAADIVMAKATNERARTICEKCYYEFAPERIVLEAWLRAGHLSKEWGN